tara:strand:- start:2994 stop:3761 length:768 start_codon:yes stop_codon:yes gene_type:complete
MKEKINNDNDNDFVNFGYKKVTQKQKEELVNNVFTDVTNKYDMMNDIMSFGAHRFWKKFFVDSISIRQNDYILDLASGTGDIAALLSRKIRDKGHIFACDNNLDMLALGRDRLIDKGIVQNISYIQSSAENISFSNNTFNHVTISFGLRNTFDMKKVLHSIYKVLKPGGSINILEFSEPEKIISPIYKKYLNNIIPLMGKLFADDEKSYRYLSESIEMHPGQSQLIKIMEDTGFEICKYNNLMFGVVAVHRGYKI